MDLLQLILLTLCVRRIISLHSFNAEGMKDSNVIEFEKNNEERDIKLPRTNSTFKTVCYYPMSYSLNTTDKNPMPPGLDANLCSHVIFIPISNDKFNRLVPATQGHADIFRRVIPIMRRQNPQLKIMASCCSGGSGWGPVIRSIKNTTVFAAGAVDFMKKYDFDGVDLDWEFPSEKQAHNFSVVLMELRKVFDAEAERSKRSKYILSAAVLSGPSQADKIYEIDNLKKSLDFVNMMGYDYNGPWSNLTRTAYNSPLTALATSATFWGSNMGPDKVVVGIPFYCHAYKLLNPADHGLGAWAIGKGECDFQGYTCACQAIASKNGTSVWDYKSNVPYCYYDNQWISYENELSVAVKTKWIQYNGFAGLMTWNMKADDYEGLCDGKTKYPLMKTVLKTISGNH